MSWSQTRTRSFSNITLVPTLGLGAVIATASLLAPAILPVASAARAEPSAPVRPRQRLRLLRRGRPDDRVRHRDERLPPSPIVVPDRDVELGQLVVGEPRPGGIELAEREAQLQAEHVAD